MKHILIPTDFSANSWNALKYAACLYGYDQCTFYVLYVEELSDKSVNKDSIGAPLPIHKKLNLFFEQLAQLKSNFLHQFITLRDYGNFTDIIKKTVDEKKIDLIIMGAKGTSNYEHTIFGRNTVNVITKVPCNVLVVSDKVSIKKPSKIGFPTDYNIFYTYPILKSLTEVLRISNATLDVVHVTQAKTNFSNTQIANKAYLHDYLKEMFTGFHCFKEIQGLNIKETITTYLTDNSVEMLTMAAKNINLFQQLFFNPSKSQLNHQSSLPLLVLHE